MEIKQFITETVERLADYSHEDQVNIFNEIKANILAIRKQRHEANIDQIKSIEEQNQLLSQGSASISGEAQIAKTAVSA